MIPSWRPLSPKERRECEYWNFKSAGVGDKRDGS
jgi:hypothetical protein